MPIVTTATEEDFASFERGSDREDPRTAVRKGGYESASNVILTSTSSGRVAACVYGDEVLDALVTWPAGNATWTSPFTYSVYNATLKTLTFSTHLLIARDTGQIHRYDPPATSDLAGTVTNVRRGMTADAQINPFVYDQWLCLVDGRDAPMKYGQHFLWNTQLEPTPFLFPLGSRPISPLVPSIAGETWTLPSGCKFQPDEIVPLGSRVGAYSLYVNNRSNAKVTFTPTNGVDYTLGPQPYGGDLFNDSDYLVVSMTGADQVTTTGNVKIRFIDKTADSQYFEYVFTPAVNNTAWRTFTKKRSAYTTKSGAPKWTQIKKIVIYNDDKGRDVIVDDLYWLYANAPPALAVAGAHKSRIVGGGAPVGATAGQPFISTLVYSDASHPDNYPSANFQVMSGGSDSLAQANGINAVREYGDQMIIGCPSAIYAWTIGDAGNPVKSTISAEHGIDSHRGIVETPQGSLIFPWQRGFYIMRSTGRQFIGSKIQPLLVNMDLSDPTWTCAVVDEKTKTIRISFREGTAGVASQGLIFDVVRAQELGEPVWPSTFTQLFSYACPAYVNGNRETLYVKDGDPHVYRLHVTRGGVGGSITLPWQAREHKDKMTKWSGIGVPYIADSALTAQIRYASIPGGFDSAVFGSSQTLPASSAINEQGRAIFGGPAKWAQVRLTCAGYFEIYPPVTTFGFKTERVG